MPNLAKAKKVSEADTALWESVTKDVTPLNKTPTVQQQPPRETKATKSPIYPKHTWDLHGHSLSEAWALTQTQLQHTHYDSLLFITGKSGDINREFQSWAENHPQVKSIQAQPSGGAYRVWLRKPKK